MNRVTSTEFLDGFERYRELARREPVVITDQGRDTHVLLSASAFARLSALDTRRVYRAADLPDDLLEALERAHAPAWTARYDDEVEG